MPHCIAKLLPWTLNKNHFKLLVNKFTLGCNYYINATEKYVFK